MYRHIHCVYYSVYMQEAETAVRWAEHFYVYVGFVSLTPKRLKFSSSTLSATQDIADKGKVCPTETVQSWTCFGIEAVGNTK